MLPLYSDHAARYVWDGEGKFNFIHSLKNKFVIIFKVSDNFFLYDRYALKCINHGRKIIGLLQPAEQWFQDVMQLYGLTDLCMVDYLTINHSMLFAFVERWHSKTSFFRLPHSEITITLDDVSCNTLYNIRLEYTLYTILVFGNDTT